MVPTVKDIANLPVDQLPPVVHVPPVVRPFDITVRPPGSKSLTNRALLLAALAEGTSVLTGALAEADDAQVMVRALRQLGAAIEITPEVEANGESCGNATMKITGVGGRWKMKPGETVTLNLNNAGTAVRFLTAAAILQPAGSGGIVIDGNERMRERPIGELVEKLQALGARIEYEQMSGRLPIRVLALGRHDTNVIEVDTTHNGQPLKSSQTLSAIALLAPWLSKQLVFTTPKGGSVTSASYLRMTGYVLQRIGMDVVSELEQGSEDPFWWMLKGGKGLQAFHLDVESDASGASYFFAAAPLVFGATCRVVSTGGIQGDWSFVRVVEEFGGRARTHERNAITMGRLAETLEGQVLDFSEMPDCAMTAAALAAFATGPSRFSGLRTLRVKETDRIAAMRQEWAKVGVSTELFTDGKGEGLRFVPPPGGIDCSTTAPRVEFDTYDDHRMAMSLALIGLRRPNVFINNPACVRKTYPTFWRDLAKVYG